MIKKDSEMADNPDDTTSQLKTTDIVDIKKEVDKNEPEKENEQSLDETVDKKTKMVSMTEARRKAVGYERKFCYIIGFPIDLDMEELVAEMINLGCKNPTDIKWYTDEF